VARMAATEGPVEGDHDGRHGGMGRPRQMVRWCGAVVTEGGVAAKEGAVEGEFWGESM
jgi:hypothetical protein